MLVYFSPYSLTPLKAANRHSTLRPEKGVYLKIKTRFTEHYVDYFPHTALGDSPLELFLENFKFQNQEYSQKILHILLKEEAFRSQKIRPFLNHDLWDGVGQNLSEVVKYKLKDPMDDSFLRTKGKLRLDANGMFDLESFEKFKSLLPLERLEYIEDPMGTTDWSMLKVPLASDFINGSPHDFIIHKPNARFYPKTQSKVIFSSYMGSDLGRWHSYCELNELGDLTLHHGLKTPGLYVEQKFNYESSSVNGIYKELYGLSWKNLCSI